MKELIKNLIKKIPTNTEELFEYPINWTIFAKVIFITI
jgi:hypothetical protein